MMRYEVNWTPFAVKCLDEIYQYLYKASFSKEIAKKQIQKLTARTDQLIEQPKSGKEEELLKHLNQNSRYLLEGNYKIIYQIVGDSVIITDVFHVKQNPKKIARRSRARK